MARAKYAEWLTEQGLERLAEMAPRLTDAEMAKEMGISSSTFYEWLKKHPEMSEAVTRARTGADARANNESVERSLLETALGGVRVLKKPMKLKTTSPSSRSARRWSCLIAASSPSPRTPQSPFISQSSRRASGA